MNNTNDFITAFFGTNNNYMIKNINDTTLKKYEHAFKKLITDIEVKSKKNSKDSDKNRTMPVINLKLDTHDLILENFTNIDFFKLGYNIAMYECNEKLKNV